MRADLHWHKWISLFCCFTYHYDFVGRPLVLESSGQRHQQWLRFQQFKERSFKSQLHGNTLITKMRCTKLDSVQTFYLLIAKLGMKTLIFPHFDIFSTGHSYLIWLEKNISRIRIFCIKKLRTWGFRRWVLGLQFLIYSFIMTAWAL